MSICILYAWNELTRNLQYGRQNIEKVKQRTQPKLIARLDSEDESRNASGVKEVRDDEPPIDEVDNGAQTNDERSGGGGGGGATAPAPDHEFKKPLLPSELKPTKRKHKKHHSNGNTVISRDDAMILVPDGVQSTDGFTFIRTPRGSDNENSDTEVSHIDRVFI